MKFQTALCITLLLFVIPAPGLADLITASSRGGYVFDVANVANSGAGQIIVAAVTIDDSTPPVTSANVTTTATINGAPAKVAPFGNITTGLWPFTRTWGPTVNMASAKAPGDIFHMDTVSSATLHPLGGVGATGVNTSGAGGESFIDPKTVQLTAAGNVDVSVNPPNKLVATFPSGQQGFGRSVDPLYFNSGPNTFGGVIPAGLALVSQTGLTDVGYAAYMTMPLNQFSGSCLRPITGTGDCLLYSVSIYGEGIIQSVGDVTVALYADPSTLMNFSAFSTCLNRNLVFDSNVDGVVLENDCRLPSFTLSPTSDYNVNITVEDGALAAPEPSTVILFSTGFVLAELFRFRNRKLISKNRTLAERISR